MCSVLRRSCFAILIASYLISISPTLATPPDGTGRGNETTNAQAAREQWIKAFGHRELQSRFYRTTIVEGQPHADVVPIKLVVTTAENDGDAEKDDRFPGMIFSRAVWYGVEIAEDWRIHHFYHSSRGTKGGGGSAIPESNRKRLDELISNLPQDAIALPPAGRRVLVQVAQGDHYLSRIYDRANAPVEVLEILRLSHSGIRSFVTQIKPQTEWQVYEHGGAVFSVCPDGETLFVGEPGWPFRFAFWNSPTQERIRKDEYWPMNTMAEDARFSPDNEVVALFGHSECSIVKVTTGSWKHITDLHEPADVRRGSWRATPPSFTADGKFLLLQNRMPAIRAFDTTTWQMVDPPSYLPAGVLAYIPARKSNRAVIGTARGSVALWDAERRQEYATLDEDVSIRNVAFSSDESLVAAILTGERKARIGIWNLATGDLIHELHPHEQITGYIRHLLWTPDDKYLVSATKADSFFSPMGLSVWNVNTGRHRGDFTGPSTYITGIGWLNGGKQIAAGCQDGKVRIWDFEAARKEIKAFEQSLEGAAAASQ